MDRPEEFSHPQSGVLVWPEPEGIFDLDVSGNSLDEGLLYDWHSLDNLDHLFPDGTYLDWPQYTDPLQYERPDVPQHPEQQDSEMLQGPKDCKETPLAEVPSSIYQERGFKDVSDWLGGAYCPPFPCSYCRQHRLQCLILRTTSANPNPVTSCSSCVALFRECSLALGEKRQPSGFETLSPVLGHLHGVTEHMEDGLSAPAQVSSIDAADGPQGSRQFLRKGARILREWYYQHQDYPYPSEDQKDHLCRETNFSRRRISTWFANARRRHKQKLQPLNIPPGGRAGSPMPTELSKSMTPMERWQASPPEDEPVPESAIKEAVASARADPNICVEPGHVPPPFFDPWDLEGQSHLASSVSSFGSRASEGSSESASSAWSHQSSSYGVMPFLPISRRPRSRRRRPRSGEQYLYQCTFCEQSFKKRHDWSRHEKSIHLALDSWICTPDLTQLLDPAPQPSECRFCEVQFQDQSHWEEHEFTICATKPTAERSFSRKDHLWQHLRKFHGCTKLSMVDVDSWRSTGDNIPSRCGFCESPLSTWTERTHHLAEHFKKGFRMDQWMGDWGFEPSALNVLRNAVLPSQRSQGPVVSDQ